MKNVIILIIAFLCTLLSYAQKTYLIINQNSKDSAVVMYPPGTPFELRDSARNIVLEYAETPIRYAITTPHTLQVFPDYKETPDTFALEEGSVELAPTIYYNSKKSAADRKGYRHNDLDSEKVLTKSSVHQGLYNLVFKLENGITFKYTDGDFTADLNGSPIHIEGKYLIYSEIGILKLSFNPKTGVVWWVFENK